MWLTLVRGEMCFHPTSKVQHTVNFVKAAHAWEAAIEYVQYIPTHGVQNMRTAHLTFPPTGGRRQPRERSTYLRVLWKRDYHIRGT